MTSYPASSKHVSMCGRVIVGLVVLVVWVAVTGARSGDTVRVTYISADAVYVDGGKDRGATIGDTLVVHRDGKVTGRLLVTHISSRSAACVLVDRGGVRVGDVVQFPMAPSKSSEGSRSRDSRVARAPVGQGKEGRHVGRPTRVSGYLGYQHVWQRGLGENNSSWSRPGATVRLAISNIGGREVGLKVRHRSLKVGSTTQPEDQAGGGEWAHRLSEASVVFGSSQSPVEVGIGRVFSPYVRGIGYIDGGYVAVRVLPGYRVGVTAGAAPNQSDYRFSSDRMRVGGFVALEHGEHDHQHLSTTIAVSMSYAEGLVNREFVYLQNRLSVQRKLSLYQSLELDINRQWRREQSGERWTFSNLHLTAKWQPVSWLLVDGAYDTRRNVWTYHTMDTPDSLFDGVMRRGVNGGLTIRGPRGVTFRAHAGIRYGESKSDEVQFASANLTMRNLPMRTHHLSLRMSRSKTQFTVAYRPILTYRLPTVARIIATLGGGAYLYDTAGIKTNSYFYDAGLQRTFAGRYYASGSVRHYAGGILRSLQGNLEVGVNF